MSKRILFLLIVFMLFSQSFIKAAGVISGLVKDRNAISLPGANLRLDKFNRYTISRQDGYYEFLDVPEGVYKMTVTYIGFSPTTIELTVTKGKNSVVDVVMNEEAVMGKEIVIMGELLKGQAQALNQQKNSLNISNIISSDQVGHFPDSNIGDALKRVPGITMQNDQGEARDIIIRGLAPELNSVSLNGNRVPSAEGDNRNVQMDLIPSDMISSIKVSKTISSDMDADAIGGSVDLVTRSAPNKSRVSSTLKLGYNPIRNSYTYSGALVYGNRFFNNKLGLVLSTSLLEKNYGSDEIEGIWKKQKKTDEIYLSRFDIRKYNIQRVRRSVSAAFDYKINDNNSISANLMYNWRDDRENRYRLRYSNIKPVLDDNNNIESYVANVTRQTKGGIDNNRNKNTRLEDQRVKSITLKGNHLLMQKMDLTWNLNYSKASEYRPNERYLAFRQSAVAINQDLSDFALPLITTSAEDHSKTKLHELTENRRSTEEEEYSAKIDARVPLSLIPEQKGRLRFGLRGRVKAKLRDNILYSYKPLTSLKNLESVSLVYQGDKRFSPGEKYNAGMFPEVAYLGGLELKNTSLFTEKLEPKEFLAANYTANEQIYAGYLRWDQNITNDLLFIIGLRTEKTVIDYTGNKTNNGELIKKDRRQNNYWNLFPNFTFNYNVNSNMVLKAAFTTALARPNYYNLVPYSEFLIKDQKITIGNPDLKATRAYNFDLMGEYYFKSVGLFSLGVFYKNMQDFVYNYTNLNYTNFDFGIDFPDETNLIQLGDEWTFRKPKNGKAVDLMGFELALQRKLDFLPSEFLKNLRIYLNYTYIWSDAKGIPDSNGVERKNISIPGTAPHIFNSSLSWENKRISARISFNHTSNYIMSLGADAFTDSYYDRQSFLDLNASFKITPQFRIFMEANNLTNQPLRYYQGERKLIKKLEYYRPTFNLGLKFDL